VQQAVPYLHALPGLLAPLLQQVHSSSSSQCLVTTPANKQQQQQRVGQHSRLRDVQQAVTYLHALPGLLAPLLQQLHSSSSQ
jgi:hypothetical protein